MNIRKIIDDYVECNNFVLKIIDNKIYVYYYDTIDNFTSKKIVLKNNNTNYLITGNDLIIEEMFDEELVISGNIKSIEMEENNEK